MAWRPYPAASVLGARARIRALAVLIVALVVAASAAGCGSSTPVSTSDSDTGVDTSSGIEGSVGSMVVTSPAFSDGGRIPVEHCMTGVRGGANISPALAWSGAPTQTASFAISVIDRHPIARDWVHWVIVDIPPTVTRLAAGASGAVQPPARELINTFKERGYGGPMPPPGSGEHPYEFTVYALDVQRLEIPEAPSAADIEAAVAGHVLARAVVTGVFSR